MDDLQHKYANRWQFFKRTAAGGSVLEIIQESVFIGKTAMRGDLDSGDFQL